MAKRIKLDMAEGITQWGEGPQEQEDRRSTFLYEPPTQKRGVGKLKQPFLTCHNFKLHIMTRENTEDIQTHKSEGFLKKINTKESGTLMSFSFT